MHTWFLCIYITLASSHMYLHSTWVYYHVSTYLFVLIDYFELVTWFANFLGKLFNLVLLVFSSMPESKVGFWRPIQHAHIVHLLKYKTEPHCDTQVSVISIPCKPRIQISFKMQASINNMPRQWHYHAKAIRKWQCKSRSIIISQRIKYE